MANTPSRVRYFSILRAVLDEKPQVGAFLDYYLGNVNDVIDEVGYFPVSDEGLTEAAAALAGAPIGEDVADGDILISGSSTVYPLTQRIATDFAASGFGGAIAVDSIGTQAGIAAFCSGEVDIANASRPMTRAEVEACRKAKREPIELRVGNDALAVVVSQENDFLQDVSQAQLEQIFVTAEQWSDVNAAWPSEPIVRFAPGAASGTLDFFLESVVPMELAELPKETLQQILEANVSAGLMRRFENDMPFAERTQQDVYELVLERVVDQQVVRSWKLVDSFLSRSEIEAVVAATPNAELIFRSWINLDFVVSAQSPRPEFAGVRTAILGSLWVVLITILVSVPIGIGTAIYLEEYASHSRLHQIVQTNIDNLAGVPSIIYGILGFAIFVRALEGLTSGAAFGVGDPTTANGRTILSAGLTLALLVLPVIIINAQEAHSRRARSLREAGYGLGATNGRQLAHVLPSALPGILTGTILAISRAIGETAPLVVIGASTFIVVDPSGPFSKFTTLPIQIYQWTSRPQDEFRNIAAAAILVLLIMLLSLNATAVILRNRFSTQRV